MLSKWTLHYAEFLSIFSEQCNICCPVKTIRAQVARRDKPWISNGLKNAYRKKNRLYKIWLHSQTPAAESRYKIYQKIYLPRYLEQQKKNTIPNYFLMQKVTSKKAYMEFF